MGDYLRNEGIFQDDPLRQEANSSANDSDYFSEGEGDSLIDCHPRPQNRLNNSFVCSVSDDWIELDLPANAPQSLSFLSDQDFQAVLESFAEFTRHQLILGISNPREMEGLLRNHLAYLLWRRTVAINYLVFQQIPVDDEELNIFLGNMWYDGSEMMEQNREQFRTVAEATTIPQLILSTIKSCFRKRQADRMEPSDVTQRKRLRRR